MNSLISRCSEARPTIARPATLFALCGALLLALVLALPGPAQAHDTLLSTDPADGDTLETSPEAITFTFSADVLEVSPLVRITDESGTELAEIVPTIDGPTATATLSEPLPAGTHSIQWRVVSSDGHPIEGTLALTIEQDPAAPAEPSDGGGATGTSDAGTDDTEASDAGGAEQTPQEQTSAAGDEESEPAEATEPEGDEDSGLGMGVLAIVLAAVIVGAGAAVFFIVRRRD